MPRWHELEVELARPPRSFAPTPSAWSALDLGLLVELVLQAMPGGSSHGIELCELVVGSCVASVSNELLIRVSEQLGRFELRSAASGQQGMEPLILSGKLGRGGEDPSASAPSHRRDLGDVQVTGAAFYDGLSALGLPIEPPLRCVEAVNVMASGVSARVRAADAGRYGLQPAYLNACVHLLLWSRQRAGEPLEEPYGLTLQRLRIAGGGREARRIECRRSRDRGLDMWLLDVDGEVVAHVEALRIMDVEGRSRRFVDRVSEAASRVLGREVESEANLVEGGASSLDLLRISALVGADVGITLDLGAVLRTPTVAAVARLCAEASPNALARPSGADRSTLPCTVVQEELHWLERHDRAAPAYNESIAWRLRGRVDVARLRSAVEALIYRHPALRASVQAEGSDCTLHVAADVRVAWQITQVRAGATPGELRELVAAEANQPFRLSAGPLVRAHLLTCSDEESVLLLSAHHLVCDEWSLREIVVPELSGRAVPGTAGTATDWDAFSRAVLEAHVRRWQERNPGDVAAWVERLRGAAGRLELPRVRPGAAADGYSAGEVRFSLSRRLSQRLAELASRCHATAFSVLMAAFQGLLARYTGQARFCVATALAGRDEAGSAGVVGCFTRMVPLPASIEGDAGLAQVTRDVHSALLAALEHPYVSIGTLRAGLREAAECELEIQAALLLQATGADGLLLEGATAVPFDFDRGVAKLPLVMELAARDGVIEGCLRFSDGLWDEAYAEQFVGHYRRLLDAAVAGPDVALRRIPLLDEAERVRLAQWSRGRPVARAFQPVHARVLLADHDGVAVVAGDDQLSHAELRTRALCLAQELMDAGVASGETVAVALPPGCGLFTAVLGSLAAGASFLMLDCDLPSARLQWMLEDANVRVVICDRATRAVVPLGLHAIELETLARRPLPQPHPIADVDPEQRAYVIYTSGSTGTPKGIAAPHRALDNLCTWQIGMLKLVPQDRCAKYARLSFDASIMEMFAPLVAGSSVHVVPDAIRGDVEALREFFARERVTVAFLPTPVCERFQGLPCSWLRVLYTGGDQLGRYTPSGYRLVNVYGPAENTVATTMHEVRASHGRVPIGRPIDGVRVDIVDEYGELQPPGVTGELVVSGHNLALGYIGRAARDDEGFVHADGDPHGLRYRTGDMGRWNPTGDIELIGRRDRQVQVAGVRVEPGEIEAALKTHPAVENAIAFAHQVQGRRVLAAAVAIDPSRSVDAGELRHHVSGQLPAAMVPGLVAVWEGLPLTSNGKVDLEAVLERVQAERASARAPTTELEVRVAQIWKRVLRVPDVRADEHGAQLGLDSLSAVEIAAALSAELKMPISVAEVLRHPTIAEFAASVELAGGGRDSVPPAPAAFSLAPEIRPSERPAVARAQTRVLVTGATGLVGSRLLRELLTTTSHAVRCLLRARDQAHADARLAEVLRQIGCEAAQGRATAVRGDLRCEAFGLETADFEALADSTDTIFHCAADVDLTAPYDELAPTNVFGTHEVLRLASCGVGIQTNVISSVSVFGTGHGGHVDESRWGAGDDLTTGYARSKWAAEELVREAQARGLVVRAFRLGRVVPPDQARLDERDMLPAFIRGCVELGSVPDSDYQEPMISADVVGRAVLSLARAADGKSGVFHVTGEQTGMRDVASALRAAGYRLRERPHKDWMARIVSGTILFPYKAVLESAELNAGTGFACRSERTLAALGWGAAWPPVGLDELVALIGRLRASGSIPPGPQSDSHGSPGT